MDFKLSNSGRGKMSKTIPVPRKTVEEVIDLLSNVECTCVWSEADTQYIKVNDIPKRLSDELRLLVKLNK